MFTLYGIVSLNFSTPVYARTRFDLSRYLFCTLFFFSLKQYHRTLYFVIVTRHCSLWNGANTTNDPRSKRVVYVRAGKLEKQF